MKTLTNFLNNNLKAHTLSDVIDNSSKSQGSLFEVIENEKLTNCNLKGLTISGSLFSLTVFKNVTFESCVFFGSKLENCTFIGCKFIDCSFQFAEISFCNFSATTFKNSAWDYSPCKKSTFENCSLDSKSLFFIEKEANILNSCVINDEFQWMEALDMTPQTESLPPIPEEEEEVPGFFATLLKAA